MRTRATTAAFPVLLSYPGYAAYAAYAAGAAIAQCVVGGVLVPSVWSVEAALAAIWPAFGGASIELASQAVSIELSE